MKQTENLQLQKKMEPAAPKSAAQSFFESCALKKEKLPQETQAFFQLQVMQLFFNTENPHLLPIPITPLP